MTSVLALTTLPPNTGHFSNIAYFMPGTETMPNSGLPVTMSGLSTPDFQVPMILKSFGSLRVTVLRSGAVRAAALVDSSAYVMLRPEGRWVTVPDAVSHSDAFTPHAPAAAATSI